MTHPFTFLETWPLRWLVLTVLLAIAAAVMFARIGPLDHLLQEKVPAGIFALEFSWSGGRAREILDAWAGLEAKVREQTYWDYLFLLCYPVALSLACAMLADAPANPVPLIGIFVAWATLAAAPLDALENLAMLRMVADGASETLAKLATWCAGLKFTVLLAAVGYLLTAGAATAVRRLFG